MQLLQNNEKEMLQYALLGFHLYLYKYFLTYRCYDGNKLNHLRKHNRIYKENQMVAFLSIYSIDVQLVALICK